jgi:hypothetical protein
MKLYFIVEFLVVFTLVVRMVYYLKINPKIIHQNLEVINYISVVYVLILINLFFKATRTETVLEIYDVMIPPLILFPMFLNGKLPVKFILILVILFCIPFYFFYYGKLIEVLYIIAIFMVIRKAIKLSTGSSRNLQKSPMYIIITIDLLFTLMSVSFHYTSINWSQSDLICYYGRVSAAFFLSNLILFHVYIRRFFIN